MWNCGCGVHQIVMCPLCKARAEWKRRVLIIISGHKEIQQASKTMFKPRVWAIVKEEQSELRALLEPLSLSFSVSLLLGWSTKISERHYYSSKRSFLFKIEIDSNSVQFLSNTWMTNDLTEQYDILLFERPRKFNIKANDWDTCVIVIAVTWVL